VYRPPNQGYGGEMIGMNAQPRIRNDAANGRKLVRESQRPSRRRERMATALPFLSANLSPDFFACNRFNLLESDESSNFFATSPNILFGLAWIFLGLTWVFLAIVWFYLMF
jgi:hypothetical protein